MSSNHGPIEPDKDNFMNWFGHTLDEMLNGPVSPENPRKIGFALLMFDFKRPAPPAEARINYLSNAPREDMIVALKELIANFEGRMMEPPGRAQ